MELLPARRDSAEALIQFCEQFPLSSGWNPPLRRLLTQLPSSDDCLFDWQERGQRLGVAVLIDRVDNRDRLAPLEMLGRHPECGPEWIPLTLPRARMLAKAADRVGVEFTIPEIPGYSDVLLDCGMRVVRDTYTMCRENPDLPSSPLPSGFRWRDFEAADARAYYRLIRSAFSEDPGMQFSEFPAFEESSKTHTPPIRLLLHHGKIVGFTRVSMDGSVGDVDVVGRDPDWKGQGLGALVLAEAARLLRREGARSLRLGVSGSNRAARLLYQRSGFVDQERLECWRMPVEG